MALFEAVLYSKDMNATSEFSDWPTLLQSFLRYANQQLNANFNGLGQLLQHLFSETLDEEQVELLSMFDRKQLVLALSLLIPLQPVFFPSGFSPYRLKKLCELLDRICHAVGKIAVPRDEQWRFEISGEKMGDFLENCYRRQRIARISHAQKCQEYEIKLKDLQSKLTEYRQRLNITEPQPTSYNISFNTNEAATLPSEQASLSKIPLIQSVVPSSCHSLKHSQALFSPTESTKESSTDNTRSSLSASLVLNIVLIGLLLVLALMAFV